jgi:hypothetical protein
MRQSLLVVGGHYAVELDRGNIYECYVVETKGWKANRPTYGYRGQQRPIRVAGAGGVAVMVKKYSTWEPRVVSNTKIVRSWAEHAESVRASQERARRERLAAERARNRREDLAEYVNAALQARNMRGRAYGYSASISLTFEDVLELLGGESNLRLAHADTIAAARAERDRQRLAREAEVAAEQARRRQEQAEAEARRLRELEAERTASPVASELVSGEVQ